MIKKNRLITYHENAEWITSRLSPLLDYIRQTQKERDQFQSLKRTMYKKTFVIHFLTYHQWKLNTIFRSLLVVEKKFALSSCKTFLPDWELCNVGFGRSLESLKFACNLCHLNRIVILPKYKRLSVLSILSPVRGKRAFESLKRLSSCNRSCSKRHICTTGQSN